MYKYVYKTTQTDWVVLALYMNAHKFLKIVSSGIFSQIAYTN